MYNVTKRLTDREADRLKTELEAQGSFPKLRELRGYTPAEIAKRLRMSSEDIARLAGRSDEEG